MIARCALLVAVWLCLPLSVAAQASGGPVPPAPLAVRRRNAVGAGSGIEWGSYVGLDGDRIAMNGYGASAPGGVNMEKFGFTADNILSRSMALLDDSKR